MTDLERVREYLELNRGDLYADGLEAALDAHLKEDAALNEYVAKLEWRYAELREQMKGGRAKAIEQRNRAEAELAELREAVRTISEAPTYDSDAGNMCFVEDTKDIARQLIEEKP